MKTTTRLNASPDAIALLKDDHRLVEKLFKAYDKVTDRARKEQLADAVCKLLTVHVTIEEDVLYPTAHEALQDDSLVYKAEVEHATAKDLIAKIKAMPSDDALFDPTVKVLCEYIDHHVKEEETEMFPKLKRTNLDLNDIGQKLAVRKQELLPSEGLNDTAIDALRDGADKDFRSRKPTTATRRTASTRQAKGHSHYRTHA